MTISVRQSAIADATPHAATFASTPVEGNLLVAFAEERSGETDFVMSNSGWTLGVELYQSVSDGTYRKSFATWYKIAGASEPTTVTVTTTTGSAPVVVGVAEFQGDAGEMSTIAFGAAVATGSDTPAAFYTTGTTASVASTSKLLIGHCYTKVGGGTEAPYSDWSQGTDVLTEFAERNGGASNLNSSWAWAASSVTGTNSARADKDVGSTDSNRGAITSLMVFTYGGGGNGSVTAVAATATAAAVVPVVTGEAAVTGGGPMTATMAMGIPVVAGSGAANVSAVVATATATALSPAFSGSALVQAVRPTVTAQMLAPAVSGQVVAAVNAIVATMTMLFRAPSVQAVDPTYAFYPPTHEEPMRTKVRPLNYFRLTHARSVVKVNGTYVQIYTPSPELLAGLEEGVDFFRGGYEYVVDRDTADALAADGFTATPI